MTENDFESKMKLLNLIKKNLEMSRHICDFLDEDLLSYLLRMAELELGNIDISKSNMPSSSPF